ncbi:MAG: hypothetical protein AB7Q97_02980 [Gammaproteobacteria bacterium]
MNAPGGAKARVSPRVQLAIVLAILACIYGFVHLRTPSDQIGPVGPWRDWDKPVDAQELAAYEFAHSIKLPDEPKPDGFYKRGFLGLGRTSGEAYFRHLCETEAGEFIYRKVSGVEGIYQMRPRRRATVEELRDRYRMEDPYGYTLGEAVSAPEIYVNPPWANYRYLVSPVSPSRFPSVRMESVPETTNDRGELWRYARSIENTRFSATRVEKSHARYAYIWRGIRRAYDRENRIAGGEVLVVDAETNEVLGVRRGFARAGISGLRPGLLDWERATVCPEYQRMGRTLSKDLDFNYWFFEKVIAPPLSG